MHEMSIAQSLVEIIRHTVEEDDLERVRELRMKLGECSGVVPDSLEFCFQALVANTSLSHCALHIERIPFQIRCNSCSKVSRNEGGFGLCPLCGSADTKILSGNELQVVEIEIEDKIQEST
jgi:hydrogenase nickel incorporation protein HypA/HybF